MAERENFLFWRLAYFLIAESGYRIIRITEDHSEIWFENIKNKNARMLRMVRSDLDWANWVERDKQMVAVQADKLRKQLFARNLNMLNIYVTSHPPIDADEDYLEKQIIAGQGKTKLSTIVLTRQNYSQSFLKIGETLGKQPMFDIQNDYDDAEIYMLSQGVLKKAAQQENEDRQLFEFTKPLFTYIFIAIQVLVFFILEANGGSTNMETLVKYGAKYNPLIIEGEWWRFITPIFLHIGFLHLVMNTLALYYLGSAVEKMFGHWRFLGIYLFSGFTGALASFIFSENISAGASGAIFGCFGALLYLGFAYPQLFFRTMGMNVIVLIIINLIFGFTVPGIDNAGHIGGLIGGFLSTGAVHFPKKRNLKGQAIFLCAMVIISVSMINIGYHDDRPDVMNGIVQEKIKNGKVEEAYNMLAPYVSEGKGNAITFFQLSYLEIQLKKYKSAKQHLLNAIKLQPDFHEAYFNLALLYYEEQDILKAREYAQKANSISSQKKYQEFLQEIGD
ncbi:rhomboid family protein [Lederbergia citrea]|uniref:rhomboid family protein n=1 Tax=Lederbergia citrea TaxID=2833581 RepID=UPI001BC945F8|nr:rhomboid family intramembrane serine protease [Lederbergia citrea]MBS4176342.1 rhomboid family intramembrane serine protease [Lederbergia citrea]MBS4202903.1 rhomboid family intramembrane serine protease [Lederbergia citrea]